MIKFMIIFRQPDDVVEFENLYNPFLAQIEKMPDIQRRQVVNVIGSIAGESAYYRILEIYFDSQEALTDALRSPAGQEAGIELQKFARGTYETVFAEVYEESGGQTQ